MLGEPRVIANEVKQSLLHRSGLLRHPEGLQDSSNDRKERISLV